MEMNGATLPQRVLALLRAKLHLALFAIALSVLDFATPLLASWLVTGHGAARVLADDPPLLGSLGVRGDPARLAAAAAVVFSGVALTAFLRAGYIRSLVGRFHLAPADGRQFRGMTDLVLVVAVVDWLSGAALAAAAGRQAPDAQRQAILLLIELVTLAGLIVLLYVDYAIVVSDLGFTRALRRSWQTVRANWFLSLGLVLVTILASAVVVSSTRPDNAGLVAMLPLLALQLALLGFIAFLADVVLIVVYIDSMERRRIPDATA